MSEETFVYQSQSSYDSVSSYIMIVDDGQYEDHEMIISMSYDQAGSWSEQAKGKGIMKLWDTGNGINIVPNVRDNPLSDINLDYSEAVELYMLLECYFDQQPDRNNFTIRKFQEIT